MNRLIDFNITASLCLFPLLLLAGSGWCELQGDLITTFPEGHALREMLPLNGGLWLAMTAITEDEVWFSDLTSAGTTQIKSLGWTDLAWLYDGPETLTVGNTILFTVEGTLTGIWRSDGTADGTVGITGVYTDSWGPGPLWGVINGAAIFQGQSNSLWRSDGTDSGTYILETVSCDTRAVLNNVIYFSGVTAEFGRELWRTDGTEAGTYMVKDLNAGAAGGCGYGVPAIGDFIYFEGTTAASHGLAKSDGTPNGTTLLKTFPDSIAPLGGFDLESTSILVLQRQYDGLQLWKTDGTEAGTVLVKDLDTLELNLRSLAVMDGKGYFLTDDGEHGRELWNTDGTGAGTIRLTDFSGDVSWLFGVVNGFLCFTATEGGQPGLYRSDGTTEGTRLVANPLPSLGVGYVWSQDGFTYVGNSISHALGRIIENKIEWIELRDIASGITEFASSVTHPCTIGNSTYFCGRDTGGLWAVSNVFRFVKTPYAAWREVGDPLLLTVECAGYVGTISYQWFKDNDMIDGATGAEFRIDSLTEDDEGWYSCRVTDTAKAIYETEPVFVEVFEAGSLPAAGPLALLVLAVLLAFASLAALRETNSR